ncbi:MAG: hypothetical protein AB7S86_05130 [Hydrogenophaga sp.]|uniref:hypothetical protein n=1 Tax=Hydrogenophaga sp. TaxID=1904254 RepID=UPI003D0CAD27
MAFFRWPAPPSTLIAAAAVALGLALAARPASAQASEALSASDPGRHSVAAPLQFPALTSTQPVAQPADMEQARTIWLRANERVAEFPRGHIDLLRWETRQPAPAADGTRPVPASEAPLSLAEALRQSLRHRPELFVRAGMNATETARVRVAFELHVRELQGAWTDAVSTRQRLRLQIELLEATRAGSELGQRMVNAGNWSQARLTRERLAQASTWQDAVEAQAAAIAAQERLARLLGVWQADAVAALGERLPVGLPEVPSSLRPGPGPDDASLEATVLRSHPTLARERLEAQRQFSALNRARWQDWRQAVDNALRAMPEPDAAGVLEPPRIDDLSLLRDHALERAVMAESELLSRVTERRSMTRAARVQLQVRHASAQHAQDVVVELQSALAQDSLLRYNGMLQSTWELLASARERLRALDDAVQARREFWRAQADWQALLAGTDYTRDETAASSSSAATAPAGH